MRRATRRFSIACKKRKRRLLCVKVSNKLNAAKGFDGPKPRRNFSRSMAFDVEISHRAFRDLDELATELKERSQSYAVARKWFLVVLESIDSLTQTPERRPVVMEAQDETQRVRLLLDGKRNCQYRIYYCVRKRGPSS